MLTTGSLPQSQSPCSPTKLFSANAAAGARASASPMMSPFMSLPLCDGVLVGLTLHRGLVAGLGLVPRDLVVGAGDVDRADSADSDRVLRAADVERVGGADLDRVHSAAEVEVLDRLDVERVLAAADVDRAARAFEGVLAAAVGDRHD